MNAKMGGVPWSIENLSLVGVKGAPPTTIIGYSIQKKGKDKVAALVSSQNPTGNRYYSKCAMQNGEIGNNLEGMFKEAFESFHKNCGKNWPKRIIIYREGVGEGQK